jgi:hypothetical protein
MASVMHQSIQIDEESLAREQEVMARLVTENKVRTFIYLFYCIGIGTICSCLEGQNAIT